jgi:hypothetical protein
MHDPTKADVSAAARQSAIQAIPFEKLDAEARRKASFALTATTLFRRMPVQITQCDPALYLFLVRHPDVVVGIWEELGLSEFRMTQTSSAGYRATDGSSMVASAEFLYRGEDTHIVYCEGEYRGPLAAKPIRGRTLLVLKTGIVEESDGRAYITSRLDTFMDIEDVTVEFLTRTFLPLVGRVADNNLFQIAAFVGSLSRTTEVNHRGIQRLASRLRRVEPEVRKEFALLARQVADKAARQGPSPTPFGTPVASLPERTVEESTR